MSAAKKPAAKPARATKKPRQTKERKQKQPAREKRTKSIEQIQAEGHGVALSLTQVAEEFNRDWETIKKRIGELDIRPCGERAGHPVYRLKDLLRIERTDEFGNIDPDKMRPADQSAYYRAQRERVEFEREVKLLYRREDIEAELSAVFRVVNYELETLVDELERDVQPNPVVLARIEDKLLQARERMYQAIAKRAPAPTNGAHPHAEVASWDVGP